MKVKHVTIEGNEQGYILQCNHCKASKFIFTPMPVETFIQIGNQFTKSHRNCQPPKEAPQ